MTRSESDPLSAKLILASRSPRRIELLREAGYDFEIEPADIDEENLPHDILPSDAALKLAAAKCEVVATRHRNSYVLGADTIVALGDQIVGKPDDEKHARAMLRLLSGTTHIVITGVAVMCLRDDFRRIRRVMSAVRMRNLTEREIQKYVDTGDWRGKAGGYGIQDRDPFVERLAGCHTNIVGLPMTTTKQMLAEGRIVPSH